MDVDSIIVIAGLVVLVMGVRLMRRGSRGGRREGEEVDDGNGDSGPLPG